MDAIPTKLLEWHFCFQKQSKSNGYLEQSRTKPIVRFSF